MSMRLHANGGEINLRRLDEKELQPNNAPLCDVYDVGAGLPGAHAPGWAIPSATLLGLTWSQRTAPSPDRTVKWAFFVALGLVRFVGGSTSDPRRRS